MSSMTWTVLDCSQIPPAVTERKATAEERSLEKAHLKAVEGREKTPGRSVEDRLDALEAAQ